MKLSRDTLMEEIQSKALETDLLKFVWKRTTCKGKFWNSQPIKFPLIAVKLDVFRLKTIQVKSVDWYLDEEMQPVALKKMINFFMVKHHTIYITNGNLDLSKFKRKNGKQRYRHWNALYEHNFVDWGLGRRNTDSCSERDRTWLSKRIVPIFSSRQIQTLTFPLQGTKCTVWQTRNSLGVKNFHWYPYEWKVAGVHEKQMFKSQEIKTLLHYQVNLVQSYGYGVSGTFR